MREEARELCGVLDREETVLLSLESSSHELSNIRLELKSNSNGLTGLFSLPLTHGGSNSLGGGESERFVLLFPNKVSSTYE